LTGLQRFLKNVFSVGVADVISKLISASVLLYLIRILTPDEFGILSFAQALVAYLVIITNMGLDKLGARKVARDPKDYRRIMSTVMLMKSLQALISFALLVVFLAVIKKPLLTKSMALLYGIMAFAQILIPEWFYQGVEKMEYIALYRIICSVVSAVGLLAIIRSSEYLIYIPIIYTTATFIGIFVLLIIFIKKYGALKFIIDKDMARNFLKRSLILGASLFLTQLLYNFDVVLLSFYRTDREVGYYSAAYKIILFIIMPLSVFFQAMFPILSRFYKESKDKLRAAVSNVNKLIPAASLPILIFSIFSAGPLLDLLFGKRYSGSIPIFQLLIFTILIIYTNTIYAHGLIAADREHYYFWSLFIAASSNVALNFIFIPKYGMVGAACTSIFAEFAGAIYSYWAFNKYVVRAPLLQWFWKPALASGVLLVYFLNVPDTIHIIYRVIGGVIVYIFFLQIQGFLNKKEVEIIRNLHPWLRKK